MINSIFVTYFKMKKILIFIMILSLCSCSDYDDKIKNDKNSFITFIANGENYSFGSFLISKQPYENPETGYQWIDVRVLAYDNSNSLRAVEIIAEEGIIGTEAIWKFQITTNGNTYTFENSNFSAIVVESSNEKLEGNFSGTLVNPLNDETLEVSNGTFKLKTN